jgi:hypothetical protein
MGSCCNTSHGLSQSETEKERDLHLLLYRARPKRCLISGPEMSSFFWTGE